MEITVAQEQDKFVFNPELPKVKKFYKTALTGWKMRLYQLKNVPGAAFFRLRMEELKPEVVKVSLPYSWRSRNPFKSIYFVGLLAAAEYSTAMMVVSRLQQAANISFIVKSSSSEFLKKAKGRTTFTCVDHVQVDEAVNLALKTGKSVEIPLEAIGTSESGEVVCRVKINWSIRCNRKG